MATVILFRGRNTDRIIADARTAGIVCETDNMIVVCRHTDPLAQPGDKPVAEVVVWVSQHVNATEPDYNHDLVVVANGGTTQQAAPILIALAEGCGWQGRVRVVDVQPDGATPIIDRRAQWGADEHGVCPGCGQKIAITETDGSWDYCECPGTFDF